MFLPAAHRPRQGQRGVARQSHPLAVRISADGERADRTIVNAKIGAS
jgi:hypothetical protein